MNADRHHPNPASSDAPSAPDTQTAPARALTFALAGNPNAGKTTIFNTLTGARQRVGNYPGVTVEKKTGRADFRGRAIHLVDLPGTYSLAAYSLEEVVARQFILDERPDVVISIVDASNLERNLYLTTQLLELGVPVVVAFNMADVAEARGIRIDTDRLSHLMGVPIVPTVGHKGKGVRALMEQAMTVAARPEQAIANQRRPDYGQEVEPHVQELTAELLRVVPDAHARWYALKLLENDPETIRRLSEKQLPGWDAILEHSRRLREHIRGICGDQPEIILADLRYGFISGACSETLKQTVESRHLRSDHIDKVLIHPWAGPTVFALLMFGVFHLTFTLGEAPMGWIETGVGWLAQTVSGLWPSGSDSILKSLLVDGVIHGVGGVIVFLPNIVLLFLAIAFLEDTGYMARAAFLMDRLMHKIGLHGKSFIPMLIGFGCSVPAVLATRVIETRRDRLTTMLVVPLMSCSARLPIYALIIPAFFPPAWRGPMLAIIYAIGIALAIGCAKLLRTTVLRGESEPFIMELPPYRMPTMRGLVIHTWDRAGQYVKKAGTVILGISIVLWAVTTFPQKQTFEHDYDALADQAQASFAAELRAFNDDLGLAGESDALIEAVRQARLVESGYDRTPPPEQAQVDLQADLLAGSAGQRRAAMVTAMRWDLQRLRQRFEDRLAERHVDPAGQSSAYVALLREHEQATEQLRRRDPAAFAAAQASLNQIEPALEQRLAELGNQQQAERLTYSLAGRTGKALGPVLRPMGFDWRIGTALIGAVAAKEVFVAQLGIVFAVGEDEAGAAPLRRELTRAYTPLVGFCVMLFCLVSTPCMATVAATRKESASWRWALLQLVGLTVLAWVLTTAAYQIGQLFI